MSQEVKVIEKHDVVIRFPETPETVCSLQATSFQQYRPL